MDEKELQTSRGPVLLVRDPTFEYIFPLSMGEGMGIFFHYRDQDTAKTRKLLSSAVKSEKSRVVCALYEHTVIGYVLIVPAEAGSRWKEIDETLLSFAPELEAPVLYELGSIEVSRSWRSEGVGSAILLYALEDEFFDRKIVISRELSWHWDLKGSGLGALEYRTMLLRFFEKAGFRYCETDDEEIGYSGENMLTVRIGCKVPPEAALAFYRSLTRSEPRGWGWG